MRNLNEKNQLTEIGIRPVIDGRRMGVRESLEEQNHEYGESHRRADRGKNCVTPAARRLSASSPTALRAWRNPPPARKIQQPERRRHHYRDSVLVLRQRNYRYGPAAAKSHLGTLTAPSAPAPVYLAAALAAHCQKGIPAFSIYGHDVRTPTTPPFRRMSKKTAALLPAPA